MSKAITIAVISAGANLAAKGLLQQPISGRDTLGTATVLAILAALSMFNGTAALADALAWLYSIVVWLTSGLELIRVIGG